MTLGDNYTEMQGSNQELTRTATATFVKGNASVGDSGGNGCPACYCYQQFANLTYGLTTGVLSDPSIGVHHTESSNPNPTIVIIAGVGIGAVAIVVVVAIMHRRKIRKKVA
jgi:hypothetical protein